MTEIILAGGGGHCRSCIDVIEAGGLLKILGVVDPGGANSADILGYSILGSDDIIPELINHCKNALVTVGQIKTPQTRIKLFETLKSHGAHFPVVVSPLSYVSKKASLGEGTIVMHGAIVNACAQVGANCIINTGAFVEHDAIVGDHCHVSTGSILNGGVQIGAGTFVGSGAVIHQGIKIGKGCIIAAGAVVRTNVPASTVVREEG